MFFSALKRILLIGLLPFAAMADGSLLTDLEGNKRSLDDYTGKGQWTVVMIWESSCGVCNYEAPKLEAFHQRHSNGLARVVGISADGAGGIVNAQEFVDGHELSFVNLLGDAEEIALLFYDATGDHLPGTPGFLVFGPGGEVRTYQVGAMEISVLERFIQQQERLAALED